MDKLDVVEMVEAKFKIHMREPILSSGGGERWSHVEDGLEVVICLDYLVLHYELQEMSRSNIDFWLFGIHEANEEKVKAFLDLTYDMILANEARRQDLKSIKGVVYYE